MVFGLGSGDMIVLTDPLEGAICLHGVDLFQHQKRSYTFV